MQHSQEPDEHLQKQILPRLESKLKYVDSTLRKYLFIQYFFKRHHAGKNAELVPLQSIFNQIKFHLLYREEAVAGGYAAHQA